MRAACCASRSLRAAMSAAFPPRSLGAPSSRLIARQENSAAALRSPAFAGTSRLIVRRENSAAAVRSLGRPLAACWLGRLASARGCGAWLAAEHLRGGLMETGRQARRGQGGRDLLHLRFPPPALGRRSPGRPVGPGGQPGLGQRPLGEQVVLHPEGPGRVPHGHQQRRGALGPARVGHLQRGRRGQRPVQHPGLQRAALEQGCHLGGPGPGQVQAGGARLHRRRPDDRAVDVVVVPAMPGATGFLDDPPDPLRGGRGDGVGVHVDAVHVPARQGHILSGLRRADREQEPGAVRRRDRLLVREPGRLGPGPGLLAAAGRRPHHGVPAAGQALPDGRAHLAGVQQPDLPPAGLVHLLVPPPGVRDLIVALRQAAARRRSA